MGEDGDKWLGLFSQNPLRDVRKKIKLLKHPFAVNARTGSKKENSVMYDFSPRVWCNAKHEAFLITLMHAIIIINVQLLF